MSKVNALQQVEDAFAEKVASTIVYMGVSNTDSLNQLLNELTKQKVGETAGNQGKSYGDLVFQTVQNELNIVKKDLLPKAKTLVAQATFEGDLNDGFKPSLNGNVWAFNTALSIVYFYYKQMQTNATIPGEFTSPKVNEVLPRALEDIVRKIQAQLELRITLSGSKFCEKTPNFMLSCG